MGAAEIVPVGVSDEEALARILSTRARVLLVPFHGHPEAHWRSATARCSQARTRRASDFGQ